MVDSIIALLIFVIVITVVLINAVRTTRKKRFAYKANIILHIILSLLWASRIIFNTESIYIVIALTMSVISAAMPIALFLIQRCDKKQEELLKKEKETS